MTYTEALEKLNSGEAQMITQDTGLEGTKAFITKINGSLYSCRLIAESDQSWAATYSNDNWSAFKYLPSPPVDNEQVAEGCEKFSEATIEQAREYARQ